MDANTLSPSLPQLRAAARAELVARYLQWATVAELAQLTGLLAAECLTRGIQVAGPLGTVAARLEMHADKRRLAIGPLGEEG